MAGPQRSSEGTRDETQEPIDLDRLAVDVDYRRALMSRLKAHASVPAPPRKPAAKIAPKD